MSSVTTTPSKPSSSRRIRCHSGESDAGAASTAGYARWPGHHELGARVDAGLERDRRARAPLVDRERRGRHARVRVARRGAVAREVLQRAQHARPAPPPPPRRRDRRPTAGRCRARDPTMNDAGSAVTSATMPKFTSTPDVGQRGGAGPRRPPRAAGGGAARSCSAPAAPSHGRRCTSPPSSSMPRSTGASASACTASVSAASSGGRARACCRPSG